MTVKSMHEDYDIDDLTFYDERSREVMMDDDELSPEEAGFMQGYDEADHATLDE